MKTLRETKMLEQKTVEYQCEICGKKYPYPWPANRCEKQHGCAHKNVEYVYDYIDDWWEGKREISKYCRDCEKVLDTVEIDIKEQAEALYKLAKEDR